MSALWRKCVVQFCNAQVYVVDSHVAALCPMHEVMARKEAASKTRRALARGPRGKLKGIR